MNYATSVKIAVTWTCPKCESVNVDNNPDLDHAGGCQGHGPDEYCYCDSARRAQYEAKCPTCRKKTTVEIS